METPTALLAEAPVDSGPEDPGWHATRLSNLSAARRVTHDPVPPVADDESVAGGAALIQRQLDEPFSAFAAGRLDIAPVPPIVPGLPPVVRGKLIHAAAFYVYEDLPSQSDIRLWSSKELERRIADSVNRAFTRHERHADRVLRELLGLERDRVSRLLAALVAADLQRDSFAVLATELSLDAVLAGVRLRLRVDRIDRFDDGAVAILDYKTGGPRSFLDRTGEPTDAQLLVYAIAVDEPVAGLGFYNVDSRELALNGSGRDALGVDEWQRSLGRWLRAVEQAGGEFAAGDVRIRSRQTVRDARALNLLSRFGELRRDA